MEATLIATINTEAPMMSAEDRAVPTAEFVMLDDAKLRQVAGGFISELQY